MAKTSFHLKACDVAASETHNKREKKLDYVREELSGLNESFSYIPHSLQTELANLKREVKEKTGRKLQKNAVPIKEGVLVIEDSTTMEQVKEFCDRLHERFGIIPLQIHIHRDEGHSEAKTWKPNLHAHIVCRMYNEQGRNVDLKRWDPSEMQSMAAECLGMERGKESSKKHLSSLQFKIKMQEEQISSLKEKLESKTELIEKLKGAYDGAKEGVSDIFTGKAKKRAERAEKRALDAEKQLKAAVAKAKKIIDVTNRQRLSAEERAAKAEKKEQDTLRQWRGHQSAIDEIEQIRNDKAQTIDILQDAAIVGLSAADTLQLVKDRKLEVNSITDRNGNIIEREDGTPIRFKLEHGRIMAFLACSWDSVWSWAREVLHSPWFQINGIPNDRRKSRRMEL